MIWINITLFMVCLFILTFIYALFERYWMQIKKYNLEIDKQAFIDLKIIFLTDFHHSSIVSRKFIRNIVRKVNDLDPDIIILGGDYIINHKRYIKPLFNELSKLQVSIGIFGVIGNHDVNVSKQIVLDEMIKANINSLDNKSYWINLGNERIKIGGVGDYLYDKQLIEKTTADVSDKDYVILVSHNPDYIEDIRNNKIDLMLSGHTHGGQVTIFGLYAPSIPSKYKQKYLTGLKTVNNIKIIISNGVGVVGLPIRFFARPQIVLIKFETKDL